MTGDEWLSLVRIARDLGSVEPLLPDGITNLTEIPQPIHEAISMALIYIGYEELPKDERPPKEIWLDPDRLKDWAVDVERRRNDGSGWGDSRDIEDPVENQFAAELKRKMRGR